MDSSWIASTSNQGLRPVSAPGQRDHGVLVQLLAQHLGEEHAALFAEPVPNPDGRTTDWYAPLEGEAQPLEALDPAARAAAEQRLAAAATTTSALSPRAWPSRASRMPPTRQPCCRRRSRSPIRASSAWSAARRCCSPGRISRTRRTRPGACSAAGSACASRQPPPPRRAGCSARCPRQRRRRPERAPRRSCRWWSSARSGRSGLLWLLFALLALTIG